MCDYFRTDALGDLYVFDPTLALWHNLTGLVRSGVAPCARSAAGFAAAEERLYLFGGQDGNGSELEAALSVIVTA